MLASEFQLAQVRTADFVGNPHAQGAEPLLQKLIRHPQRPAIGQRIRCKRNEIQQDQARRNRARKRRLFGREIDDRDERHTGK